MTELFFNMYLLQGQIRRFIPDPTYMSPIRTRKAMSLYLSLALGKM